MSNIEVGEYVRTSKGYLFKTTEYWVGEYNENPEAYEKLKHSKNIIDLIEVGDYINGFRVDKIVENLDDNRNSFVICNEYIGERQRFKQQDIRTIVTKEQFKKMEYRVDE